MKKNTKSVLSFLLAGILTVFFGGCAYFENAETTFSGQSSLAVHYLDVGQGDAVFIELPNRKTMLIDAGTADRGAGIVEYIEDKGYEKIDYLLATHPHADHIGGMETVIGSLEIGEMYMPRATAETKTYRNLLLAVQKKGLSIHTAKAGVTVVNEGNIYGKLLAPNSQSYEDLNNYSAVFKLTYGEKSFLFMGDAEEESEQEITGDVSADVLKAGHHGSSTSTSAGFLQKVSPEAAVISCGKDNSYGHPHRETLENLKNAGVTVYRTDTMGTVIAYCDGTSIQIQDGENSIRKEKR